MLPRNTVRSVTLDRRMTEELKPLTRLRVHLVEKFANLFGVPHTIHREELPEVKLRYVEQHCEDCMTVAERVFGMDEEERTKFYDWLYPHRVENIDNPFNLHDGAFHECCWWIGIELG